MPTVRKERKRLVDPTGTTGLVDLESLDVGGLRMCIYGRGKTGKTRLASTFPKPLLILGTQDYLDVRSILKKDRAGIKFVLIQSGAQYEQVVKEEGRKFQTVVLDTAGGLQDIKLKEILGLGPDDPMERSWGMAQMKDWQVCGAQVKQCLRWLLDLSQGGTNSVVVAHERWFGEDADVVDAGDVVAPRVAADLTPSVSNWLNGACDYVCHTFVREQKALQTNKATGKKQLKPTGGVEFCLRVGPSKIYYTGFRVSEKQLPEDGAIADPTYEKIAEYI